MRFGKLDTESSADLLNGHIVRLGRAFKGATGVITDPHERSPFVALRAREKMRDTFFVFLPTAEHFMGEIAPFLISVSPYPCP